jgi:hypothetical protein
MSIPILLDGVVSSLIRTAIHNDLQVKLQKQEREEERFSSLLQLRLCVHEPNSEGTERRRKERTTEWQRGVDRSKQQGQGPWPSDRHGWRRAASRPLVAPRHGVPGLTRDTRERPRARWRRSIRHRPVGPVGFWTHAPVTGDGSRSGAPCSQV